MVNTATNKVILGIDPGSRLTGYGVIASNGTKHRYIASGHIATQSKEFSKRLEEIYRSITEVICLYQPTDAAIEQVFVQHNVMSALKLGQARGAAIVAMAIANLPIAEYTARRVKQVVVGYGNADKIQVQHMVKNLLQLSGQLQADAADALAVAMCHAQSMTLTQLLATR